ncbi:Gfo/Idh/MocA family oxidoreductase [Brevundimonas variabilis]
MHQPFLAAKAAGTTQCQPVTKEQGPDGSLHAVNSRIKHTTGIALIGCGYVADFYMSTLLNHRELVVQGVFDRDPARLLAFSQFHSLRAYDSLGALLSDPCVDMVLNLTNPASHYDVSLASLKAGRHVYSEKPLTLDLAQARHLVEVAERHNLSLTAAPATYLGEAAHAAAAAIASGKIGKVRLVYAELDDGMVFRKGCEAWRSASGAAWPVDDEFANGCTLEHASYYVTWLCEMFGPVRSVTAFASRQFDDKGTGKPATDLADDFSVSCLSFDDGVVARITCGLVAPRDRSFRIIGDDGVLTVADGWDTRSQVFLERTNQMVPTTGLGGFWQAVSRRLPLSLRRRSVRFGRPHYHVPLGHPGRLDYARGPSAQAQALREGKWSSRHAKLALHVTEVTLIMAGSRTQSMGQSTQTSF